MNAPHGKSTPQGLEKWVKILKKYKETCNFGFYILTLNFFYITINKNQEIPDFGLLRIPLFASLHFGATLFELEILIICPTCDFWNYKEYTYLLCYFYRRDTKVKLNQIKFSSLAITYYFISSKLYSESELYF